MTTAAVKSETKKASNAASRLHKALSNAQGLSGGSTHLQLARAFGLKEPLDAVVIVRTLTKATHTVDEVMRLVKEIPGHELYMKGLDQLKTGLALAAGNSDFNHWKQNYIRPEQVQVLEYAADLLSKHYSEDQIADEELQKIIGEVDATYESVLRSALSPDLKVTILDFLGKIREAVHDYHVRGVYGIQDAVATSTGKLVLHREKVRDALKDQKQKQTVEGVLRLLEYVDKVTAISTHSRELFKALMPYIPLVLDAAKHGL